MLQPTPLLWLSFGAGLNKEMNASQTIFSLFYAILYGAIFTISDRWRPFTFAGSNNPEGRKRVNSGILMLGLFPVAYFILCFFSLSHVCRIGFFELLMTIYLVSPLYAIYVLWVMLVSFQKDKFYSKEEQRFSPIHESLFWIANRPPSNIYLYIFCGSLVLLPIIISFGILIGTLL